MSVCNLPHFRHTHIERRSDSVTSVSAVCPLALYTMRVWERVCVHMRVSNIHSDWVWSWASVCLCWRGYCQGMGGYCSVLSDWLTGGAVYIVAVCPVKRNRPPADYSQCIRQSSHTKTHMRHYSPCFGRRCYYADHSSTLAGWLPGQKYGVLNKLTDIGHVRGKWLNKLKYYCNAFTKDLHHAHKF